MESRIHEKWIVIIILVLGIILRSLFLIRSLYFLPVSTDEAYVGLMAKHILIGEFPLLYWGTGYQGPLESYLAAPIIALIGLTRLSVRLIPFLFSILFLFVTYILARRLFDKETAVFSLLFVSIPPAYLLMSGVLAISPYDHLILIVGSLILLISYTTVYRGHMEINPRVFITGLLGGIGFWMHMIVAPYILTSLIIIIVGFLSIKYRPLSKRIFTGAVGIISYVIGFFIGSLPLWIHNIPNHFESFRLARSTSLTGMFERLKSLSSFTLPSIVGFHSPYYIDSTHFFHLSKILSIFLLGVFIIIAVLLLYSIRRNRSISFLILFSVLVIISFVRTERSNWWSVRYLMPLYNAFPILCGYTVAKIRKSSKVLSGFVIIIILLSNLHGIIGIYKIWGGKDTVERLLDLPYTGKLIGFLKKERIKGVYVHYWLSYRLNFESDEEIIFSPAYDERFGRYRPPYLDRVSSEDNVAYLFYRGFGIPEENFEENLKALGGSYKKEEIGPYTIFYSFSPPKEGQEIHILKAEASKSEEKTFMAFDGDLSTRWATHAPQRPGDFFEIDLGRVVGVTGIKILVGRFVTDFPRGYRVELSTNRKDWITIIDVPRNIGGLEWHNGHPRINIDGKLEIFFGPLYCRYIKITQTGSDPIFDWSIAEVSLYHQAGG